MLDCYAAVSGVGALFCWSKSEQRNKELSLLLCVHCVTKGWLLGGTESVCSLKTYFSHSAELNVKISMLTMIMLKIEGFMMMNLAN